VARTAPQARPAAEDHVALHPASEPLRRSRVAQVLVDPPGGRLLLPGELRVRVRVAAHLDEQGLVGGHGVAHGGDDGRLTARLS
jgi:hypothetical protein